MNEHSVGKGKNEVRKVSYFNAATEAVGHAKHGDQKSVSSAFWFKDPERKLLSFKMHRIWKLFNSFSALVLSAISQRSICVCGGRL